MEWQATRHIRSQGTSQLPCKVTTPLYSQLHALLDGVLLARWGVQEARRQQPAAEGYQCSHDEEVPDHRSQDDQQGAA